MTDLERWARCGAMSLTGDHGGPPLAPPTSAAADADAALSTFGLDSQVLGERAAHLGLGRDGTRSCGGSSQLMPALDGWVVMTLARPDDLDALPAVFETDPGRFPGTTGDELWSVVASYIAERPATEVAARAELLGVPAGVVGSTVSPPQVHPAGGAPRAGDVASPRVVDLSALWAGPLAASCLRRAGADVVKVEDVHRPDGARRGDPAFFDLMNGGKRSVALDLATDAGRARLDALVMSADIVITSGRSRALQGLGLDPDRFLAAGADRVWAAITAHGWMDDRVGFGDDVAATAGLVAWHADGRPRFAGDAIADPLGGAWVASAVATAWQQGGRWFLDAALAGIAARSVAASPTTAHPTADHPTAGHPTSTPIGPPRIGPARAAERVVDGWRIDDLEVAPPTARRATTTARQLGSDTDAVLGALT